MLPGYSKELQILPHATAKRDCSNAFSFRGVTFFDFFKISGRTDLQRNSKKIETTNLMKIQPFFVSVHLGVSNLAS